MKAHLDLRQLSFGTLPDHVRFLCRMIANPRNIGAIAPSGNVLADAMVAPLDVNAGPVLELGPGPGAFTRALLQKGFAASALTLVERDQEFIRTLQNKFPGVNVIHGDALALDQILPDKQFAGVISGLPLLNFPLPVRQKFIKDVLNHLQPGAPFVQFSYGVRSPVQAIDGVSVTQSAFVLNNLPPARVWVYRSTQQTA